LTGGAGETAGIGHSAGVTDPAASGGRGYFFDRPVIGAVSGTAARFGEVEADGASGGGRLRSPVVIGMGGFV
jgi:hypothetical protein